MTANVILARAIAHGARAFVLDRAGHYELLTRLVDGAQQIVLGADDSPYAVNPWDVPDPREVSREKIAFLISLHALLMGDEGLGKAEIAQLGEAIRAVYAKAATLEHATPRESMLREELRRDGRAQPAPRRGRRRRAAAQPRDAPRTSTAARAPTPTCSTARRPSRPTARWSSSTRAAARPTCSAR